MKLDVWGQTDVGLKREINQDSILIDHKISLFIVADGMGGHKGGEVASALAVETAQEVIENQIVPNGNVSVRDIINSAYKESSRRIHHKSSRENPELMGMGTTMVLLLIYKNKIYIANVGDSRAYMFKENNLWQLTEDHSLVNEQIRAGLVDPNNTENLAHKNVITRSVGFEEEVLVDIVERDFSPGETYLLCSDGLSGLVSSEKIAQNCRLENPQKIVHKCIIDAKEAGGDDNVTVLVIKT